MMAEKYTVVNDGKNADWMKALPGYKDEVSAIKAVLVRLSKVMKQFFCVKLGSKS